MVAPPSVLGVTASDDAPLVALEARITNLERHLAYKLSPPVLKKVHNGHGLIWSCQRREYGDAVAECKPPEVHMGRSYIAHKVASPERHEVKNPIWYGVRHYIELVHRGV